MEPEILGGGGLSPGQQVWPDPKTAPPCSQPGAPRCQRLAWPCWQKARAAAEARVLEGQGPHAFPSFTVCTSTIHIQSSGRHCKHFTTS